MMTVHWRSLQHRIDHWKVGIRFGAYPFDTTFERIASGEEWLISSVIFPVINDLDRHIHVLP